MKRAPAEPAIARLARLRAYARAVLWVEQLWPAIWPSLGVIGLFLCAALLGLAAALPAPLRLFALAVTLAVAAGLLWRNLRRLRRPDPAAVDRRLERDSGLTHRPLAVLADRPADGVDSSLWQAHRAWALAALPRLRLGLPHPGLATRDRRGLRFALVVALIAAFVIAGPAAPERLRAAMLPALPHLAQAKPAELTVWLTPPGFTGAAPVFLGSGKDIIRVPSGTALSASLTGGPGGVPVLAMGAEKAAFTTLAPGSYRADHSLADGRLTIRRDGTTLGEWTIALIAAHPPAIAWAAPPGPAPTPGSQQIRLPWRADGQYGLTHLTAVLTLQARPDAPALTLPITLPGQAPLHAHGVALRDLTDQPWAGLAVTAHLVATDASGMRASSAPASFVLPERDFHNPIARALAAIRQQLSLHPQDRDSAVGGLDALLIDPAPFEGDMGAYLNIGALYYALEYDQGTAAIPPIQAWLWRLALHMEDGAAARSEIALDQARQAMRAALAKAEAQPDAASRTALGRKLAALQQAIARRVAALLAASQGPDGTPAAQARGQSTMSLRADTLEKLAEAARQAAAAGDMAQARRDVRALEHLLDRLRAARPGALDPDQAAARQRAREALDTLRSLIQGESAVLDHAQSRANAPAPDPASAEQRRADGRMQRMLRQSLGGLAQGMAEAATPIPEGLARAESGMSGTLDALGKHHDAQAASQAQQAIAGLQAGARAIAQAGGMAGGMPGGASGEAGSGQDAPGQAGGGAAGPLDPLGRALATGQSGPGGAADDASSGALPDAAGQSKLRAIEQELRRRDADRTRPAQERAYLGRLLQGL